MFIGEGKRGISESYDESYGNDVIIAGLLG